MPVKGHVEHPTGHIFLQFPLETDVQITEDTHSRKQPGRFAQDHPPTFRQLDPRAGNRALLPNERQSVAIGQGLSTRNLHDTPPHRNNLAEGFTHRLGSIFAAHLRPRLPVRSGIHERRSIGR